MEIIHILRNFLHKLLTSGVIEFHHYYVIIILSSMSADIAVNISRNNYVLTFWKLIYIVFSAIHLSCSPKMEEVFAVRTLSLQ